MGKKYINMYLYFMSFLHDQVAEVVEIYSDGN